MKTRDIPHPLIVGIGGPVGSGKTALIDALCKRLRDNFELAVVTNDIFTNEDAEFLVRSEALPAERVMAVQTGGCPHAAIREDTSINEEAIERMLERFPGVDILFLESGGDNLAASFSPELVDVTIYVIDVAGGDKVPRKGGPGVTRSSLFVINKTDLAPLRGGRPGGDEAGHRSLQRREALRFHPAQGRQRGRAGCPVDYRRAGGSARVKALIWLPCPLPRWWTANCGCVWSTGGARRS